jgi:hypothetical protein
VNPADLFTKHLPSREKVHQLLGLFGCEYREGRAAAAPLLRPLESADQQGGHLAGADPLPTFAAEIADSVPHDESRLPHMYPEDVIARLFPTIDAAPAMANDEDYDPRRDCDDSYLRHQPRDDVQDRDRRGEDRAHRVRADRKKISRLAARQAS